VTESAAISILIVDDEETIRSALLRYLARKGFQGYGAGSSAEALVSVQLHRISLVLLDVHLPEKSGVDTVPDLLQADPDLAIIMLTAVNDATTASLCLQRGAFDYLIKPIEFTDLDRAIRNALKRRTKAMADHETSLLLREEVLTRTAELRRERGKLERLSIATLEALVNALEAKDPHNRGHSARVSELAALVAAEMGAGDEEVEAVRTAGRLHDIGKIGVHETVLNKTGPLTAAERDHVNSHVTIGSQILAPLTHLGSAVAFIRSHHEQWDGNGHPDGLSGEAIPLGARILGAAEVYDALTSSRPYQAKMSSDAALVRLREIAGRVLDPAVVEAVTTVVEQRRALRAAEGGSA